jgi:hypothetical protein
VNGADKVAVGNGSHIRGSVQHKIEEARAQSSVWLMREPAAGGQGIATVCPHRGLGCQVQDCIRPHGMLWL